MSDGRLWWGVSGVCLIACLVSSQLSSTDITSTLDANCSSINITECTACPPGAFPNNDTESCFCCSSGSCTNTSECLPCASGYYQPQSTQATCLPCPRGFYTNSTGSVMCQSCQAGFFSNETASMFCPPCEKGFFSAGQNVTQCEPCPLGSFCNTTRCTGCVVCTQGKESLKVGSIECTPCHPGMYKGPEDHKCLYCQDSEYQENWGGERCHVCPVDHYCPTPDISPISCPEDAFCPTGSTEPRYCMETFLRKAGDSCKLAPLTIMLLVVCAVVLIFGVICVVRKQKRRSEQQYVIGFSPKSPLLHRQQSSSPVYGITYDAEPVYAGW
ncbi:laminin subunit alpha-like [Pseudophryne corroboree]|uniref:laminin subunit alpha-like n=1 Tax=Pseudophryne corroboree TaxID=495146 RepID=UPI003081CF6A